jgi:hypothetical protein
MVRAAGRSWTQAGCLALRPSLFYPFSDPQATWKLLERPGEKEKPKPHTRVPKTVPMPCRLPHLTPYRDPPRWLRHIHSGVMVAGRTIESKIPTVQEEVPH